MIVDAHCHLDPELALEDLLAAMDRGGVEKAVLLAAAQQPIGPVPRAGTAAFRACLGVRPLRMPVYRAALRSRRLRPHVKPDNRAVYEAARAYPDRFIPFVFLNPLLKAAAYEGLDRALAGEFRGIKLHPWLHRYRLRDADGILARAADAGLPVLVHLGEGPPSDVERALELFPGLTLILAHAGIPHFERLWRIGRLRFDVAGPLVSPRAARRLLATAGPERVVWGTDAPIGIRADGGHRYTIPDLPDRTLGANLLDLLPG